MNEFRQLWLFVALLLFLSSSWKVIRTTPVHQLRLSLESLNLKQSDAQIFRTMLQYLEDSIPRMGSDSIPSDHYFLKLDYDERNGAFNCNESFFTDTNSIPEMLLINGDTADVEGLYMAYTGMQQSMLDKYGYLDSKLKWYLETDIYQKAGYERVVLVYGSCVYQPPKSALAKARKSAIQNIKSTYVIMLVRDNHGALHYSFQVPPKSPKVVAQRYNPVWDF